MSLIRGQGVLPLRAAGTLGGHPRLPCFRTVEKSSRPQYFADLRREREAKPTAMCWISATKHFESCLLKNWTWISTTRSLRKPPSAAEAQRYRTPASGVKRLCFGANRRGPLRVRHAVAGRSPSCPTANLVSRLAIVLCIWASHLNAKGKQNFAPDRCR